MGLKLRFETDGHIVRSQFIPRPEHVGFKGVVHGGIIATVLDEIMVWACAVRTRRFAFCAEMTVRYLNSLSPGDEVIAEAELTSNRRDRIFEAKAELKDRSGRILAGATGKYLPIKSLDLEKMATDFVGDPRGIIDAPGISPKSD